MKIIRTDCGGSEFVTYSFRIELHNNVSSLWFTDESITLVFYRPFKVLRPCPQDCDESLFLISGGNSNSRTFQILSGYAMKVIRSCLIFQKRMKRSLIIKYRLETGCDNHWAVIAWRLSWDSFELCGCALFVLDHKSFHYYSKIMRRNLLITFNITWPQNNMMLSVIPLETSITL
jgi:hypothetical protein